MPVTRSATVTGSPNDPSGSPARLARVPVLLRNFLYLDDGLSSQYLAQLEGGVYDETEQSTVSGSNRGGEAGAKAGPFSAQGSRGSNAEESQSRTIRQTPEADFRRLEKLLDDADGVQWLEALDDTIWQGLERGEMLRIEAQLKVPSLYQYTELAATAAPYMEMLESFGEPADREAQEAISGFEQINSMLKDAVVVAHAAGTPRFKFICPLKRDMLREDLGSLEGECIVVGTLGRRLKAAERYSLLDAMGLSGLPREERRKMERDMKKQMPDAVVSAPAALLTPLAVYR